MAEPMSARLEIGDHLIQSRPKRSAVSGAALLARVETLSLAMCYHPDSATRDGCRGDWHRACPESKGAAIISRGRWRTGLPTGPATRALVISRPAGITCRLGNHRERGMVRGLREQSEQERARRRQGLRNEALPPQRLHAIRCRSRLRPALLPALPPRPGRTRPDSRATHRDRAGR